MRRRSDLELDEFGAGFLAGWFRARGIRSAPSRQQLNAAIQALERYEQEARVYRIADIQPAPERLQ